MSKFELSDKPKKPDSDNIAIIVLFNKNLLHDEKSYKILFSKNELSLNNKVLEGNFIYIGKIDELEIYALELPFFIKR